MQFAGIDFPSLFDKDNFTLRRTTGHNMFDPESLISGREIYAGMTYSNSKRAWRDEAHYINAVVGNISTDDILTTAPRVCILPGCIARIGNTRVAKTVIPNRVEALQDLMEEGLN